MLADEFADSQLLVLTHDPVWFDMLRRRAPGWIAKRIISWSYEAGPVFDLPQAETRERIEAYAQQGDVDAAGSLMRDYFESSLKRICKSLQVPLPYRESYENDRRPLDELVRYLRKHLDANGHFEMADSDAWNRLMSCTFIANVLSHDEPDYPVPAVEGDITFAVETLDNLVKQFKCASCGKWVWYTRLSTGTSQFQCRCGSLEFR